MNCQNAQEFVSALQDGEYVPAEAADHMSKCANCREVLESYSRIGAELRLLGARAGGSELDVPDALLRKARQSHRSYFGRKMLVPRFAVAVAAGLLLILSAGLLKLRGQPSKPLWFSFELSLAGSATPDRPGARPAQAVNAGYDDVLVWGNGPNNVTGVHVAVLAVEEHRVRLAIRARRYQDFSAASSLKKDLGDLTGHEYTFTPGEPLQVPIEGGTSLVVQGRVLDHQPKYLTGGIPVEPDEDEITATSPVLLSGSKVLSNMKGANAVNWGADGQVALYAPGTGLLKVGLEPFAGSVQSSADWGRLDFTWNGQKYSLLTQSPMTGGAQPRKVWVNLNQEFHPSDGQMQNGFLGTDNRLHAVY